MLVNFNGDKLREIREERNVSQVNLADRVDCSDHYIRDLEHGRKNRPSAQMLYKIAVALEVPMEAFMQIQSEDEDISFSVAPKF